MAGIIELLGLLNEVLGLTVSIRRRIAVAILHLVGAYVIATVTYLLLSHLFLVAISAQVLNAIPLVKLTIAIPLLLRHLLAFLLSLSAVVLSLFLLHIVIIRDFILTKIEVKILKKLIESALSELSVEKAIDNILPDVVRDLRGLFQILTYTMVPIILYYFSFIMLLISACNLFNATFLCPAYALSSGSVYQVGALFLSVHIIHAWLHVSSDGEYSLYPQFHLYILKRIMRQLWRVISWRKEGNRQNAVSSIRFSMNPIELLGPTLIASLVPPLPLSTKEPKTFIAILLPMPDQVHCYGLPMGRDQQNKNQQKCLPSKWQKEEALMALYSALREIAGNTAQFAICTYQTASQTIKKLESEKRIKRVKFNCNNVDNLNNNTYGPLMFKYNLSQCILRAIFTAFETGRVGLYDMLILAELRLVNGIPVRYQATSERGKYESKECYCKLAINQDNTYYDNTYYPIYLIAAWGSSAEEIARIPLCMLWREDATIAKDIPMFRIQIAGGGLDIVYHTTDGERLRQYTSQLKGLGLKEGIHFTVKKPEGGKHGYLYITVEGVKKLAELAKHAEDPETRARAGEWINHLLARVVESGGEEARKKLEELIRQGEMRGSLKLVGVHEVEVQGERHSVVVKKAKAWQDGDKLRIHVEATVGGVEVKREFVFFRDCGATCGRVSTRADAPGGREADIKRLKALSKVIFGDADNLTSNGRRIRYTRRHLEHATRFAELKDDVEQWLQTTQNQGDNSQMRL